MIVKIQNRLSAPSVHDFIKIDGAIVNEIRPRFLRGRQMSAAGGSDPVGEAEILRRNDQDHIGLSRIEKH